MREPTEIAPGVHVATSRVMHTTSTVLAASGEALLVDPGWVRNELEGLAEWLRVQRLDVIGGFATHAHHDHLLWHPEFGDAPRWSSERTAELAASERESLVASLGEGWPGTLVELMGRVQAMPESLPAPSGFVIEPIVHDGHAPGHTALWLPEQHVLLAGDMLSDVELPLPFWPDDLPAYIGALDALAPYAACAALVVPGHGRVGADAVARLDADRRYIDEMVQTGQSQDPRRANPGMAEEYAHMQRLVRGE